MNSNDNTSFSFEFFPPRGDEATDELQGAITSLADTKPSFMTVTYGAGGSSQDGSLDTLRHIRAEHSNIALGSHLTYIASSREKLANYTDKLWDMGVRHIVALRGDAPRTMSWEDAQDQSEFQYTSDFVEWLKNRHDFEISVGAYPEKHPDAPSLNADIEALKKKCDAGADRAMTQFFFDNNIYYDFVERAQAQGITTPIVPGILPIMDFGKTASFAKKCESSLPQSLVDRFSKYEDGSGDALKEASDFLEEQVEDLVTQGVPHIHFYSMNSGLILPKICNKLSLGKFTLDEDAQDLGTARTQSHAPARGNLKL
jgi:methylenetetrahydrofolate reductase (NADPH)